MKLMFVGKSR